MVRCVGININACYGTNNVVCCCRVQFSLENNIIMVSQVADIIFRQFIFSFSAPTFVNTSVLIVFLNHTSGKIPTTHLTMQLVFDYRQKTPKPKHSVFLKATKNSQPTSKRKTLKTITSPCPLSLRFRRSK